ncbi:MAG: helix-turn-helix domain-containing protein [Pseudomonadota bacterium]
MVHSIAQLLIGFSAVAALILMIAYVFFLKDMRKTTVGIISCVVLLAALMGLQFYHWQFFTLNASLFEIRAYVLLVIATPASFFFFSRSILFPDYRPSATDVAHFLPLILGLFVPAQFIIPIGITVGCAYSLWFVVVVYGMRRNIRRFRFEAFFFIMFAVLAAIVLAVGLATPFIDTTLFYVIYTYAIGLSLALVVASLIGFPQLLDDINAVAHLTYANTTLTEIKVEEALSQLETLMSDEKVYQNENLNLRLLADAMDLTSHQLSELINTQCGMGFSRYVREKRIEEAKRLLLDQPDYSVLSISLATGFKSQSNFYTAFREVTGKSPGAFRKSD